MVDEVISFLRCRKLADKNDPEYNPDAVFIDGTLGTGGHTRAMLLAHPSCRVVAFDRDAESQETAKARLAEEGLVDRVTILQGDFRTAPELLQPYFDSQVVGSDGRPILEIHGALVDAGMSMYQISWSERGLSFNREGDLDMRYNRTTGVTAADLVNKLSPSELEDVLFHLADERWARRIALTIAEHRQHTPIRTTLELARLVEEAIPAGVRNQSRVHPATKTFAALRLAVNDEFWALDTGSWALSKVLAPSARLVMLTYSSNEDRTIKRTFRRLAGREAEHDPHDPPLSLPKKPSSRHQRASKHQRSNIAASSRPSLVSEEISIELPFNQPKPVPDFAADWGKTWTMKIVTPKPVDPTAAEVAANPLARSCKLRAIEKVVL